MYDSWQAPRLVKNPQVPSFGELSDWMEQVDDADDPLVRVESRLPPSTVTAWESQFGRAYLKSRNITKEQSEFYGLLYTPEGYFGRRVLVPVCNFFGEYRTFVARAIDKDAEKKYLYPKGCKISTLLYNLHHMGMRAGAQRKRPVWLVEGVFDAIHCAPLAVATFGKHISDSQIRLLRRLDPTYVVLLWDWDAWHETPALSNDAVWRIGQYFDTYLVQLPKENSDPTNYTMPELFRLVKNARGV